MAVLRHRPHGRRVRLEAEHLVGRSPRGGLAITEAYVSQQHAAIRWTGQCWEVKDLGSRNGTFVNEERLASGAQTTIGAGAKLAFGHLEQEWELEDDGPPHVMLVPADGGESIVAEGGFLVVPSEEEPLAAVYRDAEDQWVLERGEEPLSPIQDQAVFDVDGRAFRFCCPNTVLPTSMASEASEIESLAFHFAVSRDEEHVELKVVAGGKTVHLGARTHHYLLLTLARLRLKDAAEGIPETACGWTYQDDLVEQLQISPAQLNVEVFRIRQQFASLKFRNAAMVIERRPRVRQLRIGAAELHIAVL